MGSSLGGTFSYHSDKIHCPKCNKRGQISWDGTQFIEVTGGFYERLSKKAPYPIELVCGDCGAVGRDIDSPAIWPPAPLPERQDYPRPAPRKSSR